MGKPLRQTLEIPLGEETVAVDVTFRILEIVERQYDMRAEFVGKLILENEIRIKRVDIARVITDWIAAAGVDIEINRAAAYEAVLAAPIEQLRVYVGCIQGAIYYTLREMTAEELHTLARGEDLASKTAGEDEDEEGAEKKSKSA